MRTRCNDVRDKQEKKKRTRARVYHTLAEGGGGWARGSWARSSMVRCR